MSIDFDALNAKAKDLAQTSVAKAKELTDSAIDKSKELIEIGKLKVQNAGEEEAIKKAYLELGKLYYAEHGLAPDAAYAALCQQVTESKGKIEYNNERIADIKAAGKAKGCDAADAECACGESAPEEPCPCQPSEPEPEAPADCPCCGGEDKKDE